MWMWFGFNDLSNPIQSIRSPTPRDSKRASYESQPQHRRHHKTVTNRPALLHQNQRALIKPNSRPRNNLRWFLTKPGYTSWHDVAQQPDHGGFLWIKGNPGTGKSTLMKLLFVEAKLNAKGDSSQITLSFL